MGQVNIDQQESGSIPFGVEFGSPTSPREGDSHIAAEEAGIEAAKVGNRQRANPYRRSRSRRGAHRFGTKAPGSSPRNRAR